MKVEHSYEEKMQLSKLIYHGAVVLYEGIVKKWVDEDKAMRESVRLATKLLNTTFRAVEEGSKKE